MSGSTSDPKSSPQEDTLRETPVSKAPDWRTSAPPAQWRPPSRRGDIVLAGARLHAYSIRGPLGWMVALALLLVVGVMFALVFVFAIGLGAAVALGAAIAGALGFGVAGLRRLGPSRREKLSDEDPER